MNKKHPDRKLLFGIILPVLIWAGLAAMYQFDKLNNAALAYAYCTKSSADCGGKGVDGHWMMCQRDEGFYGLGAGWTVTDCSALGKNAACVCNGASQGGKYESGACSCSGCFNSLYDPVGEGGIYCDIITNVLLKCNDRTLEKIKDCPYGCGLNNANGSYCKSCNPDSEGCAIQNGQSGTLKCASDKDSAPVFTACPAWPNLRLLYRAMREWQTRIRSR